MKNKIVFAISLMLFLAGLAGASDMTMRATEKMNEAFKSDYQRRIVPILQRFAYTLETLEGKERAKLLSAEEIVALDKLRQVLLTVRGGKMEIMAYFDSAEGREVQKLLSPAEETVIAWKE